MSEIEINLKPNQKAQGAFLGDLDSGESAYISGWGGGKTWAGARKLLMLATNNQCPSLAVAPTYGDLGRFVVPALREACEDFGWTWVDNSRAPDQPHVSCGGLIVHTMTAEKPQRFAGFEVGAIWIDEAARIRTSAVDPLMDAPMQIRSRLRHPDARSLHLLVTTTPEGSETWVERDFVQCTDGMRRLYRGSTLKNRHLPASYVDGLKSSLPPELLEQYLHGNAVNYVANRAHPQFSDTMHVLSYTPDERLPVHMCCDFNVAPMAWCLAQEAGGVLNIFDEVYIEDGATVSMGMRIANDQGWGKFPQIIMHVDKSAKNRSTVGPSQWATIEQAARGYGWSISGDAFGANPPINARIDQLSTCLLDGNGKVGLKVDPRCTNLLEDFRRTARGSNGYSPGSEGKRGHQLDGVGYMTYTLYHTDRAPFSADMF